MAKTSLGMNENLEGALSYLLGFITGILFFILEKNSRFVKFHAMQSIIFSVVMYILYAVLAFIPVIGWIAMPIVGLIGLIAWIFLMWQAYQNKMYKLPVIGEFAAKQIK